jgi:hypothetical protein
MIKIKAGGEGWNEALKKSSRTTRWRAKKRGYICVKDKEMCFSENALPINIINRVTNILIYRYFREMKISLPLEYDFSDVKQEILVRAWELHGKYDYLPENEKFLYIYGIGKYVIMTMTGKYKYQSKIIKKAELLLIKK